MGELVVERSRCARPHADRERRDWQSRALVAGLVLVLWITRFSPTEAPATPELDPSWAQALGWALVHRLQFGVDVVFTYGPLGWFAHSAWQPELVGWKLWFFEIAFRLALAGFLVHAWLRLCGPLEKLLFALLLVVPDPGIEAFYFAAIVCLSAWLHERRERSTLVLAPALLLLAIIACIKFSYLLVAGFAVACIAAQLFRSGARRKALLQLGVAFAALLLVWTACGQKPWNLPVYAWRSWEVSRGYAQAMGHAGESIDLALALGSFALGLASIALPALDKGERALRCLIFAGGAFVSFKAGFVISGTTQITTFGFAFLAPYLLAMRADETTSALRRRGAALARALACVLALWGYQRCQEASGNGAVRPFSAWNERFAFGLEGLTRWSGIEAERVGQLRQFREQHALPRIRARVGGETIDALPTELGVLFLNDLNWRPRPVIQSYAAYTPALIELNARHFRSERAPRFVLLRYGTIDNRLPGADDAGAFEALLEGYRIVLVESSYALLERQWSEPPKEPVRHTVFEASVGFGESVDLPQVERGAASLRVEMPRTLRGRAYEFLVRTPELHVRIETADGFIGRFRAVPGELEHGVLIDPWPGSPEVLERLLTGSQRSRVTRVRFACAPEDAACFQNALRVRVDQIDDFEMPPASPELERAVRFPSFDPPPDFAESAWPMSRGMLGAVGVSIVHAPSELRFDLAPGRWHIRAQFGLLPDAWQGGETDGAAFLIGFKTNDKTGTLFRQYVDPRTHETDRTTQQVERDFDLPPNTSLTLRTNVGPNANGARDWCYWTNVQITPAN